MGHTVKVGGGEQPGHQIQYVVMGREGEEISETVLPACRPSN